MQNRHKNDHHTYGRAHIAWFESLDTKATIPEKKNKGTSSGDVYYFPVS